MLNSGSRNLTWWQKLVRLTSYAVCLIQYSSPPFFSIKCLLSSVNCGARLASYLVCAHTAGTFTTNTQHLKGLPKGLFLWGVLKSGSGKNSQLLPTWPFTIVRRKEGGANGWPKQSKLAARARGGGQRLKLHHKSGPERKHNVTPTPSLWPTSLFLRTHRPHG